MPNVDEQRDLARIRPTHGSGEHTPPSPSEDLVDAWSSQSSWLEVAGEWYRADNLRELFRRHSRVSESGAEIRLPAVLVPDPGNPFDRNAVAVFVDNLHVGYMERADARRYHSALAGLVPSTLAVQSRHWVRGTQSDTWARVTIKLPEPAALSCPNVIPDGAVVLPAGGTVQVTREEEHLERVAELLQRYGSGIVVAATLCCVEEQRPRSVVEVVEVAIDGHRVGVLSATQTGNLAPLVKRAAELGRPLACRAAIRGNSLKADVSLHVVKGHELTDDELRILF